jgi:hypothetical protein
MIIVAKLTPDSSGGVAIHIFPLAVLVEQNPIYDELHNEWYPKRDRRRKRWYHFWRSL